MFLYENAWGRAFKEAHPKRSIHRYFDVIGRFDRAAIAAAPHLDPLVVLRDPVRRLLSAYSNRVVHRRVMERRAGLAEELAGVGLTTVPEPSVFFERLADFRARSFAVSIHTEPTAYFIGDDLEAFAHVHKVEEINGLNDLLSQRCGAPVALGRHQTGGPKITPRDLSLPARRAMEAFVEPDFALLGRLYPRARLDLVGSAMSRITAAAWDRVFGARR